MLLRSVASQRGLCPESEILRLRVRARLLRIPLHERARLEVPEGTDEAKVRRVLEKAEQSCLISNSLNTKVHLEAEIHTAQTVVSAGG